MLAILGALNKEIAGVRNGMVVEKTLSENGCHIYLGQYKDRPLLLVRTGMGKKRAEDAANLVLEKYPVEAMVSIGVGGALTHESRAGDVVLCSTLCCNDSHGNTDTTLHSDAHLMKITSRAPAGKESRLRQGKSLTVERPVSGLVAKLAAGKSYRADIVEMESYWIASAAHKKHVPFLAIRAVSDTVEDNLPPFHIFKMEGGINWNRAVFHFASHPHHVPMLIALRKKSRNAIDNLTSLADYLITNCK